MAAAIGDYRELARRRLPRFLFEYIDGGSYDEVTLHRNRSDLLNVTLRQRVLRDVSALDPSATLFGKTLSIPLVLAPVGLAGMNARRGEVQAYRAAAKAGVPFCLSTVSVCPIDEVARSSDGPLWFQLYMIRDRGFMVDLLAKAREAGCSALVFTVDMPLPGARYRDYRSGLAGAPGLRGDARRVGQALQRPRWVWDVGLNGRPHQLGNIAPCLGRDTGLEDFFAWMRGNFDPTVTWNDLAWVRENWDGPLIIKGILDPNDAREAVLSGADGLVVSNHGGRQLDGVFSSSAALPAIAEAVDGRIAILADGAVRSGLDIVRLRALGADAVMVGRAWAYALAARGQTGVEHILEIFRQEMLVTMALTGCVTNSQIDRSCISRLQFN